MTERARGGAVTRGTLIAEASAWATGSELLFGRIPAGCRELQIVVVADPAPGIESCAGLAGVDTRALRDHALTEAVRGAHLAARSAPEGARVCHRVARCWRELRDALRGDTGDSLIVIAPSRLSDRRRLRRCLADRPQAQTLLLPRPRRAQRPAGDMERVDLVGPSTITGTPSARP